MSYKSREWETQTLSACANSSRDIIKSRLVNTFLQFWAILALFGKIVFALFVTFEAIFVNDKGYGKEQEDIMRNVIYKKKIGFEYKERKTIVSY